MTLAARQPGASRPRPGFSWTAAAALILAGLTLSALFWPAHRGEPADGLLLVVDPVVHVRGEAIYRALADYLGAGLARPMRVLVAPELAAVPPEAWPAVGLVLCPDRVALGLPPAAFAALAAARRQAPDNLRPRAVLVYRREAGGAGQPWLSAPGRTILGDTLSLTGCGPVCRDRCSIRRADGSAALSWGADPYDHGAVLEALRSGCFDYALVREWTARRFREAGLLDASVWAEEPLSAALPDVVVMVSRQWAVADRVRAGELLLALGRQREGGALVRELQALRSLARIDVDGFNLLLESDFDLVRRQYGPCRPTGRR